MRKSPVDPTAQRDLFSAPSSPPTTPATPAPSVPSRGAASSAFSGATVDPELDDDRLSEQLKAVIAIMRDGTWRTLAELARLVNAPEASVSARLRDLRKERFGAWTVDRRRVPEGNGLHEYRVSKP